MGFEKYQGSVKLGSGLTPQGGASFPLMQSCDIMVDNDGKRLDAELIDLRKLAEAEAPSRPQEVETEAEMNEILANATEASIGTIYKYTGNTCDLYEQGALYILSDEIPDGDDVRYR